MASVNTRPEATVAPMNLLLRFLHIGSDKCSFNKFDPEISLEDVENRLECIINMGRERTILPISIIRKVYQSKYLLRTNETMFALAFCARQHHILELRTMAYQEALTLIENQADFLMFLKYCTKLNATLRVNNANGKGFGRGMRNLVKRWYGKYTSVELANMFGENRGLYNWTHKDVLALAHLNPKLKRTSSDTAANAAAVNEPPPEVLIDRENVIRFNFRNGQEYLKYLSELEQPLGDGALRMKALQQYKTNESTAEAVLQIQSNHFKLNQTPAHLLERMEIWEALLPSLKLDELIDRLFTLKDLGFLNPDRKFAKKYVKALTKNTTEISKMNPIRMFMMKRLYEKNERYLAKTKKMHYAKKMEKRGVQINEALTKQLNFLFEQSAASGIREPINYFIAMDLRPKSTAKHILRNEHIDSNEAMILLAYSIKKQQKNAIVFQYTDDKEKMSSLKMPTTNFEAAKAYCEKHAVTRTRQTLQMPLTMASTMNKKIDVFVVMTESVARFCRQGQLPADEFLAYKRNFNKTAKFVVLNLCRPKPDLVIPPESIAKGFFEINGFDENTPKLLNALGNGAFS